LQKKNPLKNKAVLFRLNPYAKTLRRQELLKLERKRKGKLTRLMLGDAPDANAFPTGGLVLQGVLLLGEGPLGQGLTGGSDNRLDFIRVDNHMGRFIVWTEGAMNALDEVYAAKSGYELPTAKIAANDVTRIDPCVTTRGQLQQVQVLDVAGLDSRDVSESLDETLVVVVNNQVCPSTRPRLPSSS
jgi:hypothetical protein